MAMVLALLGHPDACERLRRAASIEAAAGCKHEVIFEW